jgi:hypothetical protein
MNRLGFSTLFAAASLVAGCAVSPQAEPTGGTAQIAVQTGGDPEVVPSFAVDAQAVHPGSEVRCREVLKPGSNVIITQCRTADDWKRYERRESLRAQALVRALQGSHYEGAVW